MAIVDLDLIHQKVTTKKLTNDELLEILGIIGRATSFKHSEISINGIFNEIAKYDTLTDDIIKYMYEIQDIYAMMDIIITAKILDKGSKKLFDMLWNATNVSGTWGKWVNLFRSIHANGEQLQDFYDAIEQSESETDSYQTSKKNWFTDIKWQILKHPNCPEKIQDANLKSRELLEEIAKKPYPSKKALEAIQNRLFYPDYKENDVIFVNFLKHSKLPWIEIAKIAELTKHLKAKFGDGSNTTSAERITAIFNFCKRSDTPVEVRNFLYQHTQDNDFLPQVAKDVFLF